MSEQPAASSANVSILSAADAYRQVLDHSGSRSIDREVADLRTVTEVEAGTGKIINCVAADGTARCSKNAGGWPSYAANYRPLITPRIHIAMTTTTATLISKSGCFLGH